MSLHYFDIPTLLDFHLGHLINAARAQPHFFVDDDGNVYSSAPDLSGVEAVAAKYCPATPSHPIPRLAGFGSTVRETIHRVEHPADAWVDTYRRLYREHEARLLQEHIEEVIARAQWVMDNPEQATLWDLVMPRYIGKP